ncbi:putative m protein repeat protein [Phaeomoniella chlamydospora]|uniref:Putative m protein repeat protein n=1 Tax=Phaeomoniella chlamydospora TaxID=158046 RepID=A0A0G2F229_PHACM|nr:putative m protein repeat protein [Phaeomoniella chlamydospora]
MASVNAVSSALFEWVASFHLRRGVRSAEDLNDGILIWDILRDIDPNFFTGNLPETDPTDLWVPRWQNLKYVHKLLTSFLAEICGHPSPNIGGTIDLQAIAQEQSARDLNLLLKLVLLAAISSERAEEYVMRMPQLSISTQSVLKDIITEVRQDGYDAPSAVESAPNFTTDGAQDLELAFEERVGKIIADNDKLQNEKKELQDLLDSMHERYAQLQEKHDSIQRELEDSQERLLHLRSGADSRVGREEARSKEQEHMIASLESKHASAQEQIENLRRQNETLRLKNENAQKLQDDFDEIKIERDHLLRKANAAEKYKQKLQQGQDWEKQNQLLQTQIDELKRQLKQSDSSHLTSADMEREIDEYKRMLPRIEQDRHELSEMKKQLEYDNHVLLAKLEHATQQQARDAATIDALRERAGGSDGPGTPTTPRPSRGIPSFDDDDTIADTEALEKPDFDSSVREAQDLEAQQEKILQEAKLISEKESAGLLEKLRSQFEEGGQFNQAAFDELQKEFADRIESSNKSTQRVIEYAKRQINVISNLRGELSSRPTVPTESRAPSPPPIQEPEKGSGDSVTLREENEKLHQELRLMASAWHNLSSRLQSPNVTIARGRGGTNAPDPISWLGRQRKEVDRVMLGGVR